MKTTGLGWATCTLAVLCLVSCDKDDKGTGGGAGNQDLAAYQDDVSALLENTFSGIVDDAGGEIFCRFEGDQFEFHLQLASAMSCTDSAGQAADCSAAAAGVWQLAGGLDVSETYDLTGMVSLSGAGGQLHVELSTDIPCYQNSFGAGTLDTLQFDSEINQVDLQILNEQDSEEWELCMLNVSSIQ
jgi:hypothetical protein